MNEIEQEQLRQAFEMAGFPTNKATEPVPWSDRLADLAGLMGGANPSKFGLRIPMQALTNMLKQMAGEWRWSRTHEAPSRQVIRDLNNPATVEAVEKFLAPIPDTSKLSPLSQGTNVVAFQAGDKVLKMRIPTFLERRLGEPLSELAEQWNAAGRDLPDIMIPNLRLQEAPGMLLAEQPLARPFSERWAKSQKPASNDPRGWPDIEAMLGDAMKERGYGYRDLHAGQVGFMPKDKIPRIWDYDVPVPPVFLE
jgi:hypothetical protein